MGVLLTVAYDGTNYCGWQRQKNAVTVQQRLEECLTTLYKQEVTVTGASRTDTGVHALGQRALMLHKSSIPVDKIPYALNTMLPEDIRIRGAETVPEGFHPQYGAVNKTYRYRIHNASFKNPIIRNYAWHVFYPLDFPQMERAAAYLLGTHDFSAFCATGGSAKTTVRTIYSINLYKDGEETIFDINGSGFLYNMVRIIAGTLVYCGCGKLCPDDVPGIILSKNRTQAGITAPPQGLTLMEINYSHGT